MLIGGQRKRGRQIPAGQRTSAGWLGPQLHPGLLLRVFLTPPDCIRVQEQDVHADCSAQLPGCLARRVADYYGGDRGGPHIVQGSRLGGNHCGLLLVNPPAGQRSDYTGKPDHTAGQVLQVGGCVPGQRQRRANLRIHVLPGSGIVQPSGLTLAPGNQVRHRGQFKCRGTGSQPPRRTQHTDELIVGQGVQAVLPDLIGELGQLRARGHHVCSSPGSKPLARPVFAARLGQL
ncbi:MAG: hypothetical protein ACLPKI_31495 [Streptosporangiaceae bacterium]